MLKTVGNCRTKKSPAETQSASRGRSTQRRAKQTKSYAEEENDEEGMCRDICAAAKSAVLCLGILVAGFSGLILDR